MARQKRSPARGATSEPTPQIHPMPFPGESPTVSLALAAGAKYGLQPDEEKPARKAPRRRAATGRRKAGAASSRAKAANPARKAKKAAGPSRKARAARATKPARARKGR